MTEPNTINVLFVDTDNTGRSLLAESVLNHVGSGVFRAYSAGSRSVVHLRPAPQALQVLETAGISIEGLYSKNWEMFKAPTALPMNLVITLCDKAAAEDDGAWPGQPACAHWAYPDPGSVEGSAETRLEAYRQALHAIRRRLDLLVSLPIASLNRLSLQQSAHEISRS